MARTLTGVALLLLISIGAIASPIASSPDYEYTVKDRHEAPPGWSVMGPAPSEHLLDISIGLKQSRFDELERILYQGT